MAHKKGVGSSENGRDSKSKRLGVKLYGGQAARAGNIIIRQRGSRYHIGENVYNGKDWTIHAKVDGTVAYRKGRRNRTIVSIIPFEEVAERLDAPVAPKKEKVKAAPAVVETVAEASVAEPVTKKTPKAPVAAPVVEEAPKAAAKPAAEKKPKKATAAKKAKADTGKDDLRKIEGVGPKIASLLNDAGILTFADVAATDASKIKEILVAAGSRYGFHNPTTWPKQASFAADGKWDELKVWQDELKGGKE